ncbi:hypothetical protein [Natronincola ferrireducens]|uniref:Sporulation membrane protein YtrI C-terminal domain-containing protein n=1 Tax=Natronincola ferrireducens TaxID=393762 RepID=A0A1G8WW95_9FIRM|nr:hypothetical protein [Natronincola ferrireducens]SDJ82481.1 hypothetical protein SAMN05660472_00052 [Natronincola ferrireducens]
MKKRLTLTAVFAIGFILGLTVMNLFHLHTLDRLYRVQNQLTNQLLDKELKLERLNESIQSNKASIVKNLIVDVEFEGNLLLKDEIQKNIHFYMADLVGRELWRVDGEMIYKILEGRIFEIENRQVRLRVQYIIISEEIRISVKAQMIEKL